ncbi:MAG: RluA family pseudouridine synthase [Patescibacteria group bacterium]
MTNLTPFIIYEDASILVINKPSGLVVNRADTVREKTTVMDWLESSGRFAGRHEMLGATPPSVQIPLKGTGAFLSRPVSPTFEKASEFEMRVGVVHRLDKGTSGVMVIAKTKEAFENLQKQFKDRSVQKEYIALVHNNRGQTGISPQENPKSSFIVDAPIGRNPKNRMKWAVVEGGRNAVTEFEILGVIPAKAGIQKLHNMDPSAGAGMTFTLLRCIPKTGRTHQIRVHLAAVNCPVVCDKLYLSRKDYKSDSKWCPRIFLHAEKIGFKHPGSGEDVAFEAELSEELKDLISKLKCQMSKPCVKF